jgi:hypothetical protein
MGLLSSIPGQLAQAQLAASGTTPIYTAPSTAGTKVLVKSVVVCNTDTAERTWTLWVVPNGQSVTDARKLFVDQPLAAKKTAIWRDDLILENGGFIVMLADVANKLTVTITGVVGSV